MCSLTPGAFTCTCIIVLLQDADPNTEIFCEISDPFQPLWTVCTISASCCAFCLHTHGLLSLFLDPRPLMTFSTFRSPLSLHCTIRPFPSSLPLVSQSTHSHQMVLPDPPKQGLNCFLLANSFPFSVLRSWMEFHPRNTLGSQELKVF